MEKWRSASTILFVVSFIFLMLRSYVIKFIDVDNEHNEIKGKRKVNLNERKGDNVALIALLDIVDLFRFPFLKNQRIFIS